MERRPSVDRLRRACFGNGVGAGFGFAGVWARHDECRRVEVKYKVGAR